MKWPMVKFKNVATVVTGSTPKKIDENYGGSIPFVTPGDLGKAVDISEAKVKLTAAGAESGRLLPKNSVLVCCIGATIGKTGIASVPVVTNQQINSLVFNEDKVFPKYAYHFCNTLTPYLTQRSTSTTMPIVNKTSFSDIEIPLPTLNEQKRIAAILDKADEIRRKRQQAIELVDEFLLSVFLDMFGDPVTNPKGWKEYPLGDLLLSIDSGSSPKCDTRPANDNEWAVLKLGAVTTCQFLPEENKAMFPGDKPREEHEVKPGDLLFTRKNTKDLVAATALVNESPNRLLMPDLIFRLNTKDSLVRKEFLWAVMTHQGKRKQIQSLAAGAAGSMPNISKANLKNVLIPLPPLNEQVKFQKIYYQAMTIKEKLRLAAFEIENTLSGSLSQKAFSNQL